MSNSGRYALLSAKRDQLGGGFTTATSNDENLHGVRGDTLEQFMENAEMAAKKAGYKGALFAVSDNQLVMAA